MKKQYHVGLIAIGQTAVFQYRENKDCLSCELIEYYGTRQRTMKENREQIKKHAKALLSLLRLKYPKYDFKRVTID